ncbi:hypothetical protein BCR36DRAFT_580529 [Piromyces finnis]|uniref:Meiosis-specific nuclear structural protein 1 n=1 Tax=Piromyces finnis TaxID=1754191 RepID=A0A1Y1VI84_9FUNG|nr:hypothetical protein BCR36DRAFT_580529 [Piromyces finnis]|eukprot:ORX57114.1 hypothetical protein BCR36DRAFT_580529 [Piromyces finnis]
MSINRKYSNTEIRFPNYLDLPPHDRGKGQIQYKNAESDYTISNREKILEQLKQDVSASLAQESDSRIENLRKYRSGVALNEEDRLAILINEREEMKRKRREELKKMNEETIEAAEYDLKYHNRIRMKKYLQQVWLNSPELRELEAKLNLAYINKERDMQKREKRLQDERNRMEEEEISKKLLQDYEEYKKEEAENKKHEYYISKNYSKALAEQLNDQEKRRLEESKEIAKDKELIDKIVQKVYEEDEKQKQYEIEKRKEFQKGIEEFIQNKMLQKEEEEYMRKKEEESINEYNKRKEERKGQYDELKRLRENNKNIIYQRLADEIERNEKEKQMVNQIRIELYEEKQAERERQLADELFEKKIRQRIELIESFQQQILYKKKKLQEENEIEEIYKQQIAKQAEDYKKLELMNEQKRRMKQLEYAREMERLIKERDQYLDNKRRQEEEENNKLEELEKLRLEVVEAERQRLLKEHATQLVGYLPKGVIRDENDLKLFDEKLQKQFEELKITKEKNKPIQTSSLY